MHVQIHRQIRLDEHIRHNTGDTIYHFHDIEAKVEAIVAAAETKIRKKE